MAGERILLLWGGKIFVEEDCVQINGHELCYDETIKEPPHSGGRIRVATER